jgi:uncharacterized repeat protein (TIGR03837 family)
MTWDIFCRVIDNHGDLGVCWRLSADLASRGHRVRLWVDAPAALAWMAPGGTPGVDIVHWTDDVPSASPGEVVIEAFGCDPPPDFVRRMATQKQPPLWINLEYLSAEPYVARSHGLRSPQLGGPGAGLTKWFFYPGFTPETGGLLRGPDIARQQRHFRPGQWLADLGFAGRPDQRLVSLFCYPNAALPAFLDALSGQPTTVLVTPGFAAEQVGSALGPGLRRGALTAVMLPPLSQPDYDRLLWSCDLNVVRGEDSFVRAQLAGRPFAWQIYPQDDGVHAVKLNAFQDLFLAGAQPDLAAKLRHFSAVWNGLSDGPMPLPAWPPWQNLCTDWQARLLAQTDLTTRLLGFVGEHVKI